MFNSNRLLNNTIESLTKKLDRSPDFIEDKGKTIRLIWQQPDSSARVFLLNKKTGEVVEEYIIIDFAGPQKKGCQGASGDAH